MSSANNNNRYTRRVTSYSKTSLVSLYYCYSARRVRRHTTYIYFGPIRRRRALFSYARVPSGRPADRAHGPLNSCKGSTLWVGRGCAREADGCRKRKHQPFASSGRRRPICDGRDPLRRRTSRIIVIVRDRPDRAILISSAQPLQRLRYYVVARRGRSPAIRL